MSDGKNDYDIICIFLLTKRIICLVEISQSWMVKQRIYIVIQQINFIAKLILELHFHDSTDQNQYQIMSHMHTFRKLRASTFVNF